MLADTKVKTAGSNKWPNDIMLKIIYLKLAFFKSIKLYNVNNNHCNVNINKYDIIIIKFL